MIILKNDGTIEPFGLKIIRESMFQLTAPTRDIRDLSDEFDGEIDFGTELKCSNWMLVGVTDEGLSAEEKIQVRRTLAEQLNTIRNNGNYLIHESDPSRRIFVHLDGRAEIEEYPSWLKVSIPFRLEPFWVSVDEKASIITDTVSTGVPGPSTLQAGNMQAGFFGEVPSNEFITGDDLAYECGISDGTSQHSTAGWLKFARKGKILFVAKKPLRHSISWNAINTAKCVYGDSGDKRVTIGGLTFKVRLFRGANDIFDPKTPIKDQSGGGNGFSGELNHYSEWNRLMCQIHEQAIDKSWDYAAYVENDIGILRHNLGNGNQGMYNDADLVVKSGNGRYSWCQEMAESSSYRLYRGLNGVSYSYGAAPSYSTAGCGWRPVLELIDNAGNIDTPMVIELKGPATNPEITVDDSVLKYTGILTSSDVLTIDTEYMTVKFNGVNAIKNYEGGFPDLRVGGTTFTYEGSGTLTIRWHDRWV